MATSYTKADKAMHRLVEEVAGRHHARLIEHDVHLGVLWADGGLKSRGMPAAGVARIVGSRDRASGMPDAQVVFCRERWEELDEKQQQALADHQLAFLLVLTERDENGKEVAREDENGRPKLRLRKHDAEIGFFYDVVERQGRHAPESMSFEEAYSRMTQLCFPWG